MFLEPLGIAGFAEFYPSVLPLRSTVDQLSGGNAGIAFLCELEPFYAVPLTVNLTMSGGSVFGVLGVTGSTELMAFATYQPNPAPIERHLTTAEGINTEIGDLPPQVRVDNRLDTNSVHIARELPAVYDRLGGFVAETSAEITLDSADGGLDYLVTDRVMRDRPVRIKVGLTTRLARGVEKAPPLKDFASVFEGRCINVAITAAGKIQMRVGDGWSRLDRPIQQNLYLGTGGLDGGPELAGLPRPLNYGTVTAAVPTEVDRLVGLFQVHDGEVRSILVRDKAMPLVAATDYPTTKALLAATTEGEVEVDGGDILLGQFATCLAEGYFRVAGYNGPLTCDLEGDGLNDGPVTFDGGVLFDNGVGFDSPGRSSFRRYAGGIIYRILTTRARFAEAEMDIANLLQFDAEYPYEQGFSVPSSQRPTVREVCTAIVDSVGGVVLRNRFGLIYIRLLTGAAAASQIRIDRLNLKLPIERVALPWGAPWPDVQITYAPNETPLTRDQVSAELDDTQAAPFMQPSSLLEVSDIQLGALLPDRAPLVIVSRLRHAADALEVITRLLGFYRTAQALWRVTVGGLSFRADIMSTVVLDYDRYGFDGGRPLLVIASDERPGEDETELTLM